MGTVMALAVIGLPVVAAVTWALNHAEVSQAAFGLVVSMLGVLRTFFGAVAVVLRGAWKAQGLLLAAWAVVAAALLTIWVRIFAAARRATGRDG